MIYCNDQQTTPAATIEHRATNTEQPPQTQQTATYNKCLKGCESLATLLKIDNRAQALVSWGRVSDGQPEWLAGVCSQLPSQALSLPFAMLALRNDKFVLRCDAQALEQLENLKQPLAQRSTGCLTLKCNQQKFATLPQKIKSKAPTMGQSVKFVVTA